MADSIFIPVGFGTQVVRDSSGRCFELSGFVEANQSINVEDTSAYEIEEQEICCEECEDNNKSILEDVIIAEPSSSKSSLSSSKSSLTSLYSSSKSDKDDDDDGYYYYYEEYYDDYYDGGGSGGDEDEPCDPSTTCCQTAFLEFGFTRDECYDNLNLLLVGNPDAFIETCDNECAEIPDESTWEGCVNGKTWAIFGNDIAGLWSCGFCCSEVEQYCYHQFHADYDCEARTWVVQADGDGGMGTVVYDSSDCSTENKAYNWKRHDKDPGENICRYITVVEQGRCADDEDCETKWVFPDVPDDTSDCYCSDLKCYHEFYADWDCDTDSWISYDGGYVKYVDSECSGVDMAYGWVLDVVPPGENQCRFRTVIEEGDCIEDSDCSSFTYPSEPNDKASECICFTCPTITLSDINSGEEGETYSDSVSASGGIAPYTYQITSGSLPPGLSLNVNTGEISGTPTTAGLYTFTIEATDAVDCTGSKTYDIYIVTNASEDCSDCASECNPATIDATITGINGSDCTAKDLSYMNGTYTLSKQADCDWYGDYTIDATTINIRVYCDDGTWKAYVAIFHNVCMGMSDVWGYIAVALSCDSGSVAGTDDVVLTSSTFCSGDLTIDIF